MIINESNNNELVELDIIDMNKFMQWMSESNSISESRLTEVYIMKNDPRVAAARSYVQKTNQVSQSTNKPKSNKVYVPWGFIGALAPAVLHQLGLDSKNK